MSIISLLIALILLCVVIWAAQALLAAFSIADPLRTVIWVFIVIFALLIVLGYVGAPMPYLHR